MTLTWTRTPAHRPPGSGMLSWLRRRTLRRALAAVGISALLSVPAGAAYADGVVNTVDATVDGELETMRLELGGENGSTEMFVFVRPDLGGCNFSPSNPLTLMFTTTNFPVATVDKHHLTFTTCEDRIPVTVLPTGIGRTVLRLQQTSKDQGTIAVAPAAFEVLVSGVVVNGAVDAAEYPKGSVPATNCKSYEPADGLQGKTFPAVHSTITGPYRAQGFGSKTATCTFTDSTGKTRSASATYSIVDPTAPEVSVVADGPVGENGWYTGDVSLDWTVTDSESAATLDPTGCDDTTVGTDQADTSYTCTVTGAGGTTSGTVSIKRDVTAPAPGETQLTGTVGEDEWYTSEVTANFSATDATSGLTTSWHKIRSGTEQGEAVELTSPAFTDGAGNSLTPAPVRVKVDLDDPEVGFSDEIGTVDFGEVPPAPTCVASDAVSGLAGECVVTGYETTVGSHTLTATATDNAGRTATATQTYTVLPWTTKGFYQPVDMDKVNSVKAGSTVPVKFEVFSGSTELTDTAAVTMSAKKIGCSSSVPQDVVELVTSGSTSLRYDAVAGQYVHNWKTPSGKGCYELTMTADDGSTLAARFQLK